MKSLIHLQIAEIKNTSCHMNQLITDLHGDIIVSDKPQ